METSAPKYDIRESLCHRKPEQPIPKTVFQTSADHDKTTEHPLAVLKIFITNHYDNL